MPPLAQQEPTPDERTLCAARAAEPFSGGVLALAERMNAPDSVTARASWTLSDTETSSARARLVGVRGAGRSYDGFYKVQSVKHVIEPRASYTQQFELRREGIGALFPVVAR